MIRSAGKVRQKKDHHGTISDILIKFREEISGITTISGKLTYINDKLHEFTGADISATAEYISEEKSIVFKNMTFRSAFSPKLQQKISNSFFSDKFKISGKTFKNLLNHKIRYATEIADLIPGRLNSLLTYSSIKKTTKKTYACISFFSKKNLYGLSILSLTSISKHKKELIEIFASFVSIALESAFREAKTVQESFKSEELKYKTIIDNIQVVYYKSDLAGMLIMASPSAYQMLGYNSLDEMIGKNIAESFYYDPCDRNELLKILFEKKQIDNYEIKLKTKNGEIRHASISSHVNYDAMGEIDGVEGIIHDITEIKKTRDALQSSEIRFRSLFENANDAIFLLNHDILLEINSKTSEIFSGEKNQILGKSLLSFSPEVQGEGLSSKEELFTKIQLASEGISQFFEWTFVKNNGDKFDAEISLNKIIIDNEIYIQGIAREITERKKIQQAILLSEQKFRQLLDHTNVLVAEIDSEGKYVFVSWSHSLLTGFDCNDFIGKSMFDFFHPDDIPKIMSLNQLAGIARVRFRCIDGSWKFLDGSGKTFSTPSGKTHVVITAIDITEQMISEETIKDIIYKQSQMLDGMYQFIILINTEGVILNLNRSAASSSGMNISELIGVYFWDGPWWSISEATRIRMKEAFHDAVQGNFIRYEVEIKTASGIITIDFSLNPIKDENENTIEIVAEGRNITEKKIAQTALMKSEEKYSSIVNYSSDSITLSTVEEGIFLEINPAFESIFGFTAKETIGKSSVEMNIWTSNERKLFLDNFYQSETGLINYETEYKNKNGSIVYGLTTAKYFNYGGRNTLLMQVKDITEIKKAEQVRLTREMRIQRHVNLLSEFVQEGFFNTSEPDKTLRSIAAVAGKIMNSERISIWFFNNDYSRFHCKEIYSLSKDSHSEGETYDAIQTTQYFANHKIGSVIATSDPLNDPLTSEVPKDYLLSLDIQSFIDAPIWIQGKLKGMISFEEIGKVRYWHSEEKQLALTISAFLSNILETYQHRITEEALRENEERLRTLINSMPDIVCFKDGAGRWLEANQFDLELFGIQNINYRGKKDFELAEYSSFYRDAFLTSEDSDEKAWNSDGPFRNEEIIPKPDGSSLTFDIIKVPIFEPDGARKGLIVVGRDITEKKSAEKEISLWKKRYDLLSVISGEVVYEYNPLNDATLWSNTLTDVLGYNVEHFTTRQIKWENLIHPDDYEETSKILMNSRKLRLPYDISYRFKNSNGDYVWIRDRGFILDKDDPSSPVIGVMTDITEYKLILESLRKSEENMRITLQSIGDAVIATDINSKITIMNPVAERLTGWSFEEASEKDISLIFNIINEDTLEKIENPVIKVINTGEIVEFGNHTLLISKDGRKYQVADSGAPIKDSNGNINGVVLVFRDVTDEYAIQKQLKIKEEQFRMFFEKAPYSIAIIHLNENKYLQVNPAFFKFTGYQEDDIIGKSASIFSSKEGNIEFNKKIDQLYKNGFIDNLYDSFLTKNGEKKYVLFSVALIDFAGEKALMCVTVDITEQKKLEEQLNQIQKMNVVGQLAGGIAHDFNNMLAGILGNAEMISFTSPKDSKPFKHAQRIKQISQKAGELTKKLLAFSRKGKNISTSIEVHEIILSAISILERSIDKKIRINTQLKAPNSYITGDPTLLENAILNLGINARDAMPEGGIISISTENIYITPDYFKSGTLSLETGNYLEIEISDSGYGIPHEIIDKIFEPFFTTKEVGKGTGLGLSAVYGTVKEHKGGIEVDSHPGEGTTFKIYLPADSNPIMNQEEITEDVISGTGKILLVDDESMIRSAAFDLLNALGYTPILAEDGEKAIEIFERDRENINLVILDIVMPKLNGKETFLRMLSIDPNVKVIFSSGFNREGKIDDLFTLGALGFVQKPYKLAELAKIIHDTLSKK